MISDKLYQLAFAYRDTKLWRILDDSDIFAFKLSNGEIGYCSPMGGAGEFISLALYIGDAGYDSLKTIACPDSYLMDNIGTVLFSQDCIQCSFENKSELSKEEVQEVQKYARAHKISMRGRKSFPQFMRYRPYYCPWPIIDETEQEYIGEALRAAIEVASKLSTESKESLGFIWEREEQDPIPYLENKDGRYIWGTIDPPLPPEKVYKEQLYTNDIAVTKIKRAEKKGIWECKITHLPRPAQVEEGAVPIFPTICLMAERKSEFLLPVPAVPEYEKDSAELLEGMANAMIENRKFPKAIAVRDKQTEAFLKDFCSKTGIELQVCDHWKILDDVESDIFEQFTPVDEDDIEQMLSALMSLDEQDLKELPKEITDQFAELAELLDLPEQRPMELSEQRPMALPEKTSGSYVISVSLGKGCYRHIQISGSSTLYDLSDAILEAFEFDNDHMHAFFMDNQTWSTWDAYYMTEMDLGDRVTGAYKLNQVGLEIGKKFKYLFDFGDSWEFQCKVLRELEESTPEPMVVRTKGKAPEQYS